MNRSIQHARIRGTAAGAPSCRRSSGTLRSLLYEDELF